MAFFDIGNVVRVTATFQQLNSVNIDPDVLTFTYTTPTRVKTVITYGVISGPVVIVRDALGVYHIDIPTGLAGTWQYRWASTGLGQAAFDGSFNIKPSTQL